MKEGGWPVEETEAEIQGNAKAEPDPEAQPPKKKWWKLW